MAFLFAGDAISGREGVVTANIKDPVTGVERIKELIELRNITATVEKNKNPINVLGYRGTQHKAVGWSGTGTATVYYVTTDWPNIMLNYIKTGKDLYFDITINNVDEGSSIGTQSVRLGMCNINSAEMAKIDVDTTWLDSTFNFTFSDVDILESFTNPEGRTGTIAPIE